MSTPSRLLELCQQPASKLVHIIKSLPPEHDEALLMRHEPEKQSVEGNGHGPVRCVARLCASALREPSGEASASRHPDAGELGQRCSSFLDHLISTLQAS